MALLSFLRARPGCGSAYHESKWAAEQLVRGCGLEWTVLKPGMMYGHGDHMLDHLSHALHTFPLFAGVGPRRVRPLAVGVALVGPTELGFDQAGLPAPGPFGPSDLRCWS